MNSHIPQPPIGNTSPQYMLECLARYVCSIDTKPKRTIWLDLYEKRNGQRATDRLKAEVIKQWREK